MSDAKEQILFTHKDLLRLMLKDKGIHEGYWTLLVRFGFLAGNVGFPADANVAMVPTGFVGVANVGLERVAEIGGPLTVDAAVENPLDSN